MQAIKSPLHGNHLSIISSFLNVFYFIKLLVNKSVFHKYLGKSNNKSLLLDLFANSTTLLIKKVALAEYINNLRNNWGTKKSSYNIDSKNDNMAQNKDNTI